MSKRAVVRKFVICEVAADSTNAELKRCTLVVPRGCCHIRIKPIQVQVNAIQPVKKAKGKR